MVQISTSFHLIMKYFQNVISKFQHVTENNNKQYLYNSFHLSTNFLLVLCSFFGLFPLQGVRKSHINELIFKWKSLMMFHTSFLLVSGFLISVGAVSGIISRFGMHSLGAFAFFFRGFVTGVLFLRLAQKWPLFMQKIQSVEFILRHYPPSKNIRRQLKILNGLVLFIALVEHCLIQLDLCIQSVLERDGDVLLGLERFFAHYSYPYMFDIMPYTLLGGIWIQYTNVNLTFSWTFLDMFICSTSLLVASKIFQISHRVKQLISQEVTSEDEWKVVREDFNKVDAIFREYNQIFNPLFLLSFTVNVYFLLVQLFGAMYTSFTASRLLYYSLSFGLLVIRLTSVCLGGAQIYEESKELTHNLVTMSSYLYNKEVERFVVHLKTSPTILSVDDYFHASKGILLKVFGALIAYEVILIQFDKELVKT